MILGGRLPGKVGHRRFDGAVLRTALFIFYDDIVVLLNMHIGKLIAAENL